MIKNRVLFSFWLLIALAMFFLLNNVFTFTIMLLSVIVPVVSALVAFVSAKKITVKIEAPYSVTQDESYNIRIIFENSFVLPVANASARLVCKNVFLTRENEKDIIFSAFSTGKAVEYAELNSKYSGKLILDINEIKAYDMFKIFSFKKKVDCSTNVFVKPNYFRIECSFDNSEALNIESDSYSMEKSGNDPSETFLIRDYEEGDSIKNIHYKLSSKLDKLLVKELGMPVSSDLLILFDNSFLSDEKLLPGEMDAAVNIFSSLCYSVLSSGIRFNAAFVGNNGIESYEIVESNEVSAVISKVLSTGFIKSFSPAESVSGEYAHIIDVSLSRGNNALSLSNSSTTLIAPNGIADSSVNTINFDKDNFKQALVSLHI